MKSPTRMAGPHRAMESGEGNFPPAGYFRHPPIGVAFAVQERSRLGRLALMYSARLPEHRPHHQSRNQNSDPEKPGVSEMQACVDCLCTQCFTEVLRKNRPDRRG